MPPHLVAAILLSILIGVSLGLLGGGGSILAIGSSARWAIELFDLPLVDVTRGEEAGDFSCPGSVVRVVPADHLVTGGLPESMAAFFSRSSAWKLDEDTVKETGDEREIATRLTYAPTRVLLSGWIRSPEVIAGRAAWVRARHGEGSVHLFGFRPQYRGWAQGTFQLLFRAMLLDR